MMSKIANALEAKLPPMSGKKLTKNLCNRHGFKIINNYGSHYTIINTSHRDPILLQVYMHNELKRGTLSGILARAHISRQEFLESLK